MTFDYGMTVTWLEGLGFKLGCEEWERGFDTHGSFPEVLHYVAHSQEFDQSTRDRALGKLLAWARSTPSWAREAPR